MDTVGFTNPPVASGQRYVWGLAPCASPTPTPNTDRHGNATAHLRLWRQPPLPLHVDIHPYSYSHLHADGYSSRFTPTAPTATATFTPTPTPTPTCDMHGTYTITQIGGSIVPGTTDIGNHGDDAGTYDCTAILLDSFHDQSFDSINVSSNGTGAVYDYRCGRYQCVPAAVD